jgi:TolB-like protein
MIPGSAMVEKAKEPITIDLNQFKLHIRIEHKIELTLHFDSPSRRFYISVIALVVNEMKKRGSITSIPLEEHDELLALLNETVGGSAGSSEKEQLLPRIYKKWKGALPDLEDAPLFRIMGRKRDYDNGIARTYGLSDEEKDNWANLFEYKGSGEHVRLRFSIDNLGASLNDVVIVYGEDPELVDEAAWEAFTASLTREAEEKPERTDQISPGRETRVSPLVRWTKELPRRWGSPTVAIVIGLVVAIAVLVVWRFAFYSPQTEVASLENMAFPLPDKPSIAVLPFDNLSGDAEQDYFADGITEEIITALSKTPHLFVIARHSAFTYKGKSVTVTKVAEELGVRYVLEGSVRKAGERVRIAAQLIDALRGHHVWAERYDRDLKDIFAIQDEITMKIITALQVKLTEGERARLMARGTQNLEAYLKLLQGREKFFTVTKEGNAEGRRLLEEAIALDPEYAHAYIDLGVTHWMDIFLQSTQSPRDSLRLAFACITKAIALDDSNPSAHIQLGWLYGMTKQYDKAIAECERAITIAPNLANGHIWMSMVLTYAGKHDEALQYAEQGLRLDPFPPVHHLRQMGTAYSRVGRYEEAITALKKALNRAPDDVLTHLSLASTYSRAGWLDEAQAEAEEVLKINPKFSLENFVKTLPHKNKADKDLVIEALRKAGLK